MIDLIFDIDKTLVFTEERIDLGCLDGILQISEGKRPAERNYILRASVDLLHKLTRKVRLSVATARSRTDLERLDYSHFGVNGYFILENGGQILSANHDEVREWAEYQERVMSGLSTCLEDLKTEIDDLGYLLDERFKNSTMAIIVPKTRDVEEHRQVIDHLLVSTSFDLAEWSFASMGKRLVLMPNEFSKETAINFLISRGRVSVDYYAFGDSRIDVGMLLTAKQGFTYKKAEAFPFVNGEENIKVFDSYGLPMTQEVLTYIDSMIP